jgi:hypothetical protein
MRIFNYQGLQLSSYRIVIKQNYQLRRIVFVLFIVSVKSQYILYRDTSNDETSILAEYLARPKEFTRSTATLENDDPLTYPS